MLQAAPLTLFLIFCCSPQPSVAAPVVTVKTSICSHKRFDGPPDGHLGWLTSHQPFPVAPGDGLCAAGKDRWSAQTGSAAARAGALELTGRASRFS